MSSRNGTMRIRNGTTGEIVATDVKRAQGWYERMVGLIPRKRVEPREGLWFEDCSVIHTVGMQTPIDVVFLDKERRVVRTVCGVAQNKLLITARGAHSVVELGSGALDRCDVLVGDRFIFEEQ
jgi:uncharacterized membrane protein (UPF0127 family)